MPSQSGRCGASACAHHESRVFQEARKEKPGGGNAGLDFFVIGVYGFKYAAWLFARDALQALSGLLLLSSLSCVLVLLLSCSSLTFSNLTEAFALSHRFLFVCALTRPWVGTLWIKQYACHKRNSLLKHSVTIGRATAALWRSLRL